MNCVDTEICRLLQEDARISNAQIGEKLGISVSSTSERVRRLRADGTIRAWSAVLDRRIAGAELCAFMFIDMGREGEEAAVDALAARPEVLELHHVTGKHSYLVKLRVADTGALQDFLRDHVKPLEAIARTETVISLDTRKETLSVALACPDKGA